MISIGNDYDSNVYQRRGSGSEMLGYILATTAAGWAYKALPSFSNPFLKQMPKEHLRNHLYADIFEKAYQNSGLKEKGLRIINETNPFNDVGKGLNAYFSSAQKVIVLNRNKASISGFHELGHAMNNMKGGFGKILQSLRRPGIAVAGLMTSVALFSRRKPKGEKRNLWDWLQDNCGKIAFVSMLPTVAEESLASYKGIQAAKKAGLAKPLIKNLRKFYGKALFSYVGYALVTGVSVYLASKITEIFTRPKRIQSAQEEIFAISSPPEFRI